MDQCLPLPDELPRYRRADIAPRFDHTDPYQYVDFANAFTRRTFASYDEMDTMLKQNYKRVIGRCVQGKRSSYKKLTSTVEHVDALKKSDFEMYYMDEKCKKQTMTCERYLMG